MQANCQTPNENINKSLQKQTKMFGKIYQINETKQKNSKMWIFYAILSAIFAALTAILAKIGIENVNSNLATAIRTIVVLILAWSIVGITGRHNEIANIGSKNWLFLVLSGLATGLSWLFYYKALQIGEASKVISVDKFSLVIGILLAFIVLKEPISAKTAIGGALITIGTLVLIMK